MGKFAGGCGTEKRRIAGMCRKRAELPDRHPLERRRKAAGMPAAGGLGEQANAVSAYQLFGADETGRVNAVHNNFANLII